MDYSLLGIVVASSLISCVACVISVHSSKRPVSVELQANVSELMGMVDKLMKEQRKEKMSRVRNSVKDSADSPSDISSPIGSLPSTGRQVLSKAELRSMVRMKASMQ